MRGKWAILSAVLLSVATLVMLATARLDGSGEPLSPPAHAECRFRNGKTITVDYSSPRVRGRKIFGNLVPFGEVWILGANQATTFDTTANLTADGQNVPAGAYTLFAIPNPKSWTLIINKTSRKAIGFMSYYPGKDSDLARLPMTVSKLPAKKEDMTFSFAASGDTCVMHVDWDLTRASITMSQRK